MAGTVAGAFVQGCLPKRPLKPPRRRYRWSIARNLHRRRLGDPAARSPPRSSIRRRKRRCTRLPWAPRLTSTRRSRPPSAPLQRSPRPAARTASRALESHRGLQEPPQGDRRRRLRRDGRAAADGGEASGRRRPRSSHDHARRAQELHFEDRSAPRWCCASRSAWLA